MKMRVAAFIAALLSLGWSCDTLKNHFTMAPPNPLGQPTNLQGKSLPGGTSIGLSWTNNASGDSGYEVDMSTAPFGTGGTVTTQTIAADSDSYTWTGVSPGNVYYFEVFAVSGGQLSLPSNAISVGTNVPGSPSGLIATPVSLSEIDLSWTASATAGVISYRIERSTDMGTTWSTLVNVPPSPTTYKDTGLSQQVEYCYRVFATDSDGDSLPTPMACAIPMNMETVSYPASTDFGRYTSIVVNGAGTEYVTSFDQAHSHALYTTGTPGGSYTTVALDTSTGTTGFLSTGVDLDSAGTPNFAYGLIPSTVPSFFYWATPPPATPSLIETSGLICGDAPRLRIAPGNTLHATTYDEGSGFNQWRHFIHPAGGSWTMHTVSATTESIPGNSTNYLDIDGSGNPAMVYVHTINPGTPSSFSEVVWATYLSGTWTTAVVPGTTGAINPAFAFDASGHAHAIYIEASQAAIAHGTNASGSWIIETVTTLSCGFVSDWPGIAVDKRSGRIHVVFAHNGLQYVRKDPGGAWVPLTIDPNVAGGAPSIAVDAGGMIHVAYYDVNNKKLKIASGTP